MRPPFCLYPTLAGLTLAISCIAPHASAGTIYVDDGFAIYKYSPNGVRTTFSNQPGSSAIGMAFDSTGTLYVAARDNNAIYSYTQAGVRTTFATPTGPYGLAVDSAGNVFTGAGNSSQIVKYTPTGAGTVFATGVGVQSLAFDANGNLFEGDSSGRIYQYAPSGSRTTFATGLNGSLFGMAFDDAGDLFATDWSGEINKFTPDGTRSIFATFPNTILPTGLVYDSASATLYMSEVANGSSQPGQQAIYAFSSSGVQSTFATGLYLPYGIADLQSNATPEPSSFFLLGGGLVAVSLLRRRTGKP